MDKEQRKEIKKVAGEYAGEVLEHYEGVHCVSCGEVQTLEEHKKGSLCSKCEKRDWENTCNSMNH